MCIYIHIYIYIYIKGSGFRVQGLESRDSTAIAENQLDKTMKHGRETGLILGFICILASMKVGHSPRPVVTVCNNSEL